MLRGWLVAAPNGGYLHPAPSLLCTPPQAPAMTDPSACKTTIALISGGGKGCLRAPWAPGPLLPVGLPFARVRGPVAWGDRGAEKPSQP